MAAGARTSISTSKWLALARIAPSRMTARCSAVMTSAEPGGGDDLGRAGGGDEDFADGGGFGDREDPEAAQHRVEGTDRVDLGDDDPGAEGAGGLGDARAAGAEAGYHHGIYTIVIATMPPLTNLDFKSEDSYTTSGPDGLDELAKDVTALANARGGLIIIGIIEDSQGCAESLSEVTVSDKKIGQMYNGLRARVVPYLPDIWISNLETATGSGKGYVLIAVPGSAIAPHAVRMTSRPQYSFARRLVRQPHFVP